MAKKIREIRVVSRGETGELRSKEYESVEALVEQYPQIGIDDCSTNLTLRGYPTFRGLIGPITDAEDGAVRYESPEVFESLTKKWAVDSAHKKKRRRRTAKAPTTESFEAQMSEFELR